MTGSDHKSCLVDSTLQDLRYAMRRLVRRWRFGLVVMVTLGLGIGASTTVFAVVRAFLWRPSPLADIERLVVPLARQGPSLTVNSAHDVLAWAEAARSFESLGAALTEDTHLVGSPHPERVRAARITSDYFKTVAVRPILGRNFLPEEGRSGTRVVLLSHALWQGRYGAAVTILGEKMLLDGEPHSIVGVWPRGMLTGEPRSWRALRSDWPSPSGSLGSSVSTFRDHCT